MEHAGWVLPDHLSLPFWRTQFAGCYDLAAVEESFVLAFAKTGDNDPNHLNVALNRAYRVGNFLAYATLFFKSLISYVLEQLARAGSYQISLAVLLHSETWRGLSLDQYQEWSIMIWHILALRSSRR